MLRSALAAATLLTLGLAGCLTGDDAPDEAGAGTRPDFDTSVIPDDVDWWEDFATRWIKRDAYTPMRDEVHDYLAAELEALGFDVETRTYPVGPQGIEVPDGTPLVNVRALVATIPGTTHPDHRVGLVSHYDTQTLTLEGAYDDASGVAAQYSICKALAPIPMEKTLACIFFDGEEQGLVASQAYVQDVVVEGDEEYVYDFVVGYDMTGINWPGHEWKAYLMTGGGDYVPVLGDFARHIMHEELGYPEEGVEVLDTHDRNSDERRFRDEGIPIYRFAGGRNAADYPEYHMPGDTVEYVYEFVDGRENFEAGFTTIVEASFHLILELDRTDWEGILETYG